MPLLSYAESVADGDSAAVSSAQYGRCATALRSRYAESGTDIGYAATRKRGQDRGGPPLRHHP
eukprot:3666854-Rhodomonas_salina.1